MNAFWKWLMRTNARAVFLAAVLALLGVTAFWVWMLSTPLEDITMLPSSSSSRSDSRTGLGVLAYVDSLFSAAYDVPSRNPFLTEKHRDPIIFQQVSGVPTVSVPVGPGPVPEPTPPVSPTRNVVRQHVSAPAAPTARSVSLTYRGMYKRSSGQVQVLVEDSDSKAGQFYDVTGPVFGMSIGQVAAEKMELIPRSGDAVTLQRGESAVFNGIDRIP